MTKGFEVVHGDAIQVLRTLPDGLVQCCVTSPPYWGLRDYGVPARSWDGQPGCRHEWGELERGRRRDLLPADQSASTARLGTDPRQGRAGIEGGRFCGRSGAWRGCLGLEPTPELYVAHLAEVLREVRRVLREDGTLWLVLGDSYAAARSQQAPDRKRRDPGQLPSTAVPAGAKAKDLLGIPWLVAFALRADGWRLRSDVVWAKRNPIPESVRDRPTRSYEYLFLLAKRPRYFYDPDAIREPDCGIAAGNGYARPERISYRDQHGARGQHAHWRPGGGRNRRDVWSITSRPFRGAHIATFPPELVEPCILAGSSPTACGVCGAPWRRIVEACGETSTQRARRTGHSPGARVHPGGCAQSLDFRGSHAALKPRQRRTVDWRPSCAHADGSGRCLVLDPFCGAGTTGLVALRHGRRFLGIELNADYVRLARERLAAVGGDAT